MATTQVLTGVDLLPLNSIKPSKRNVRSDAGENLSELVASIKQSGVLQPVTVRPHPDHDQMFELVAGERRWRASALAGKETIPSIVRMLSNEEADELRVIENLQRADLDPIDEAKAFEQLKGKGTVEDVAAKTGKDAAYIAQRLRLVGLIKPVQDAFASKTILLGHALEIAKYRPEEQKQIAEWLLKKEHQEGFDALDGEYRRVLHIPNVGVLKEWIAANVLCVLDAKTGFDLNDATIIPKMGACTTCQFSTANQDKLFPDAKGSPRCTIPICFFEKKRHGIAAMVAKVAKEHDLKKVFRLGLGSQQEKSVTSVPVDGYISYNSSIREVRPGDECKHTQVAVVVYKEPQRYSAIKGNVGQVSKVCTDPKCSKHHGAGSSSGGERKAPLKGLAFVEHKAGNLKKSFPQRLRWAAFKELVEKLLAGEAPTLYVKHVNIAAETAQHHLDNDSARDAVKALDLPKPKKSQYGGPQWSNGLAEHFDGKPWAHLMAVLAAEDIRRDHKKPADSRLFQLCSIYKVDVGKIADAIKKEDKEKVAKMTTNAKQKAARESAPKKIKKAAAPQKGGK